MSRYSFKSIQKILHQNSILFVTYSLPKDRMIKVVLRGVPTDITEEKIKTDIENHGLSIILVKRFDTLNKPLPLCLVILKRYQTVTQIYDITSIFYIKIKVESYRKAGPSQCHARQRCGHSSRNCGHPPRCVKCSKAHSVKECAKSPEQKPTCCSCGGAHTDNFRSCEYYLHTLSITN